MEKEDSYFSQNTNLKINITAWLEFELVYYNVAV